MPRKTSIKRKLTTNFVIVIAVTVLIFELLFTYGIHQFYYANIESFLRDRLRVTIDVYDRYLGFDALTSKAKFILENTAIPDTVEAQVLDLGGNIVESTARVPGREPVSTPDFLMAQTGVSQAWRGTSPETLEKIVAVSAPLFEDDRQIGAIRYVTSVADVDRTIKTFLLYSYLIGLAVLAIVVKLSTLMAKGMVEAINDLKRVADNIAEGNIKVQAVKMSEDEFGELSDTLNYMIQEIQKTDQLKHDFISSISHELRTPLTAIKGWSETILSGDLADVAETQMGLEIISKETERLHGLVENLLDFSKLEADRLEMDFEAMDLVSLLQRVIFQMSTLSSAKKINCQLSVAKGYILIEGDGDRLNQVFINILDNAIKYTPVGGSIMCQVTEIGERVVVTIRDTGEGIGEAHLSRIAERFYKVSHKQGGTGLGLAIAKGIIEGHRGSLTIESELGKGTAVTVIFPIYKTKVAEEKGSAL